MAELPRYRKQLSPREDASRTGRRGQTLSRSPVQLGLPRHQRFHAGHAVCRMVCRALWRPVSGRGSETAIRRGCFQAVRGPGRGGKETEIAARRLEGGLGQSDAHPAATERRQYRSRRLAVPRPKAEPAAGRGSGTAGVAFTLYYTPSIPLRKQRFGVVGARSWAFTSSARGLKRPRCCNTGKAATPSRHITSTRPAFTQRPSSRRPGSTKTRSMPHTVTKYHPGEEVLGRQDTARKD